MIVERSRSEAEKANEAARELPDEIDTGGDAGLLQKYGLSLDEITRQFGGSPSIGRTGPIHGVSAARTSGGGSSDPCGRAFLLVCIKNDETSRVGKKPMVDAHGDAESRLKRERRQALIERLNANDEYLQSLEGHERETGQLSEEELALEIERQRNLSRRGYGGGSLS